MPVVKRNDRRILDSLLDEVKEIINKEDVDLSDERDALVRVRKAVIRADIRTKIDRAYPNNNINNNQINEILQKAIEQHVSPSIIAEK